MVDNIVRKFKKLAESSSSRVGFNVPPNTL